MRYGVIPYHQVGHAFHRCPKAAIEKCDLDSTIVERPECGLLLSGIQRLRLMQGRARRLAISLKPKTWNEAGMA